MRLVLMCAVAVSLAGCAWETMGERNLRANQEGHFRRQASVRSQESQRHIQQLVKEIATLRTDLRTLQDSQRQLFGQVAELEQNSQKRAGQVQELQDLVAAMASSLQNADANWQERMSKLKASLSRDQKKAFDAVASSVAKEISRAVEQTKQVAPPPGGYAEYTIAPGDTLSAIAQAAGVSVEDIKTANGMKNDFIRAGTTLKIPIR